MIPTTGTFITTQPIAKLFTIYGDGTINFLGEIVGKHLGVANMLKKFVFPKGQENDVHVYTTKDSGTTEHRWFPMVFTVGDNESKTVFSVELVKDEAIVRYNEEEVDYKESVTNLMSPLLGLYEALEKINNG